MDIVLEMHVYAILVIWGDCCKKKSPGPGPPSCVVPGCSSCGDHGDCVGNACVCTGWLYW